LPMSARQRPSSLVWPEPADHAGSSSRASAALRPGAAALALRLIAAPGWVPSVQRLACAWCQPEAPRCVGAVSSAAAPRFSRALLIVMQPGVQRVGACCAAP
jgi:hypothetical protein